MVGTQEKSSHRTAEMIESLMRSLDNDICKIEVLAATMIIGLWSIDMKR